MSVAATPRKQILSASGTGPYTFNFKVLLATEIKVSKKVGNVVTLLTVTTDYSVALTGGGAFGGVVTLVQGLTGTDQLIVEGDTIVYQPTPYANQGDFSPERHEKSYDRLTFIAQEFDRDIKTSIKIPTIDTVGTTVELPVAAARANKALVFDVNGNIGVSTDDFNNSATIATAQALIATTQAGIATTNAGLTSDDVVLTNADVLLTHADVLLTNADVLLTGADVISAEAARDLAEGYAIAANVSKIEWQGAYAGAFTYAINDAVTYGGSSFICIQASTGNAPAVGGTAYWDDLANKGADGSLADGDYTDITVSGSGTVMTLQPDAISGKTEAVIASGDSVLFGDVNDSGNLKRDTVDGIVDVTASILAAKTDTVITASDKITFYDATDSSLPKTDTVQGILDLVTTSNLTLTPVVESMQVVNHTAGLYATNDSCVINNSTSLIVLLNQVANHQINLWLYTVDSEGVVTKRNEVAISVGTNILSPHKIVILDDTNILFFFVNSTTNRECVALLTVSANVMSLQNILVFDTSIHDPSSLRQLSSNSLLYCFYRGSYIYGCVLTVSGNTVSKGTETQLTTVASGNAKMTTYIPYIASIDKYLITGNVSTTNLHGRLFSVSGTTITALESASENIGALFNSSFFCTDNNNYILANNADNTIIYGAFNPYYDVSTMTLAGYITPVVGSVIPKQMKIDASTGKQIGNYTIFTYVGGGEAGSTCIKISDNIMWSNFNQWSGAYSASLSGAGYTIQPLATNYFMEIYTGVSGKTGFRKIRITE